MLICLFCLHYGKTSWKPPTSGYTRMLFLGLFQTRSLMPHTVLGAPRCRQRIRATAWQPHTGKWNSCCCNQQLLVHNSGAHSGACCTFSMNLKASYSALEWPHVLRQLTQVLSCSLHNRRGKRRHQCLHLNSYWAPELPVRDVKA